MRIIAGKHRGRRLNTPESQNTRPTSDRLRETVFNILNHKLDGGFTGKRVADLYAGTGALGLEAISRGAREAVFVDKHTKALIDSNIAILKEQDRCKVLPIDARNLPPQKSAFDVIFIDPPYGQKLVEPSLDSAFEENWINGDSIIIVELGSNDPFEDFNNFDVIDERLGKITRVLFLKSSK